ncbi:MAG: hypothetical protein NUV98_00085, partial [Candidatus Roizmanbacteria bacterium]|nr:hypothetical protein [Candidatus Roizmanbacteria bacterium]
QRYKVTLALAENLYRFIEKSIVQNRSRLRRVATMQDVADYLMDKRDYDPNAHVFFDIVLGKFMCELRDLELGTTECTDFRETRKKKVENRFSENVFTYHVNSELETIRQEYPRFQYTGKSYSPHKVDLTDTQREHTQLTTRLPIMGMPLLRAEADLYDEARILPRSRFDMRDQRIIEPDVIHEIGLLKRGEPSRFN